MNIINFNDKYLIHIINKNNYKFYESFLDKINICDPNFLSKSFEELSYMSLEDNDKYIGLFLTDKTNTKLYSTIIIDLDCDKNKEAIIDFGYTIEESVEIVLLCANNSIRIPGLTTSFVNFVFDNLIKLFKPEVKNIFLYVAKGIKNNYYAFMFYNKLGFVSLSDNDPNIMIYSYKGGRRKRLTRKHKNNKKKLKYNKKICKSKRRNKIKK